MTIFPTKIFWTIPLSFSIFIFFSIFSIFSPLSWGFSLGEINISSQLGEEFYAEVPVALDGQYQLSAVIGSADDYRRLELVRDPVVDKIKVSFGILSELEALIKLSSDKKINRPSVNILLKASHNGGTILENYVLAIDYNQSLSLSVPVKKDTASLPPPIEPLDEELFIVGTSLNSEPPPANQKALKADALAISRAIFKGDIVSKGRSIVRVQKGATLYQIARDAGASNENIGQMIVAIWSLNIDKFEDGNMHYLEKGQEINIAGVKEKAKTISKKEATRIIIGQWIDTNNIVRILEIDDAVADRIFSLPIEEFNAEEKDIVHARILEWKRRWLSYNIDSLMELYSLRFKSRKYDFAGMENFKRELVDQHGKFTVEIGEVHIQWMGDILAASFHQRFSSNLMNSKGTKVIYFAYEEGMLKIIDESWIAGDYREVGYPYVVGVASHTLFDNSLERMDLLRRKGYSVYNILFEHKGRKHTKIFVGRFTNKPEADTFAQKLLKDNLADYAFPVEYPHYVERGSYKIREEAIYEIKRLAGIGYTSYPLITCTEKSCNYKILVGAFKDKAGAVLLSKKLAKAGIGKFSVRP